jgi:hypothetical protein
MLQLPGTVNTSNSNSKVPTIGEICGRLVVRMLLGHDNISLYQIDWEREIAKFQQLDPLLYPDYYTSQNFHGIKDGYLNPIAPITHIPHFRFYDTILNTCTNRIN